MKYHGAEIKKNPLQSKQGQKELNTLSALNTIFFITSYWILYVCISAVVNLLLYSIMMIQNIFVYFLLCFLLFFLLYFWDLKAFLVWAELTLTCKSINVCGTRKKHTTWYIVYTAPDNLVVFFFMYLLWLWEYCVYVFYTIKKATVKSSEENMETFLVVCVWKFLVWEH